MAVLSAVVALVAYVYFMRNSPENLRGETFVIRKMQIERGLIGDSMAGEFDTIPPNVKQISSPD